MWRHRIARTVAALVASLAPAAAATGQAPVAPNDQVVHLGALARAVPRSFAGLSVETNELHTFEHRLGAFAQFVSLLRAPGQGPVSLRIGGESADDSYFTAAGFTLPAGQINIDADWLANLATMVGQAHPSVILDLNTAARSPRMAAALAKATVAALPHGSLQALEIGNEPDLYRNGLIGFMRFRHANVNGWPPAVSWANMYGTDDYVTEFDAYAAALRRVAPALPTAGPSSAGWRDTWVAALIAHARVRPGLITIHRYPLSKCAPAGSARFPTVNSVLSAFSSRNLGQSVRPAVADARSAGVRIRVDELGVATCGGVHGATDALAAALWTPDIMFRLMSEGVDGINMHARFSYPNSPLLGGSATPAQAIFYGMLTLTRMLGQGARLQDVAITGAPYRRLVVWAVHLGDGTVNMLVENKGSIPASTLLELGARTPASIQWLSAPSPASTAVSLGGQTLDSSGHWQGPPSTTALAPHRGTYALAVPPYSAALVSVPAP